MDMSTLFTPEASKPTGTRRRAFLKTPLVGLTLCVGLPGFGLAADEPQKYGGDGMPNGLRESPKIFVSIAPDGTVSVVVHRSAACSRRCPARRSPTPPRSRRCCCP
jgi:isoquinoline 1-oxidoreductase subunit beta